MCWEQRKQHYLLPWGNGANINTDTQILTHVPMWMCAFIHGVISVRGLGVKAEELESRSVQETWVCPPRLHLNLGHHLPSFCLSNAAKSLGYSTLTAFRWPVLKRCTSVKKRCLDESSHISLPFCARLPSQATDGPCSDQKQDCDWGRWLIWWRETSAMRPQHRDEYSDALSYDQPHK